MRRVFASVLLLAAAACSIDEMRKVENNEETTGPALIALKRAVNDGCLAYVFGQTPLADVMKAMPDARAIPTSESGSPTATAAWQIGQRNRVLVMQLPNGVACSASVMMGDPQRLHDAAVQLLQARAAFTAGQVDMSEHRDAGRSAWCTPAPYPFVAVIYRRTTGTRTAFLMNVFKAQGITFSACAADSAG